MIFLCSEKLNKAHTATLPNDYYFLFLLYIMQKHFLFYILYFSIKIDLYLD